MMPMDDSQALCPNCKSSGVSGAEPHQLLPGTVLKDKYLVGRVLGEGGFGITYIGLDRSLEMRVAIKEYYPNGFSTRNHTVSSNVAMSKSKDMDYFNQGKTRFLTEARALAKFYMEPGIVGVREFFEENGTAYIVMDYLDGITLKDYIQLHGVLPAAQLLQMLDPIMTALSKIHAQGLIHRDISPDNIMVLKSGQLILLDLGAAREFGVNTTLSVILKPSYAPAEQHHSKGNQGPWTDVYALCATIYKCITGVTPANATDRLYEDDLRLPSQLGAAISCDQETALMKGLQLKVQDRIQSVEELRQQLKLGQRDAMHSVHVQVGDIRAPKDEEGGDSTPTIYDDTKNTQEDGTTVYSPPPRKPEQASDGADDKTVLEQKAADPEDVSDKGTATDAEGKPGDGEKPASDPNPDTENNGDGKKPDQTKKKKKILPILLGVVAAVVVLLVGGSLLGNLGGSKATSYGVSTYKNNDSISLKMLGIFSDPEWNLRVVNGVPVLGEYQDYQVLNILCEKVDLETVKNVEYLGQGLYLAAKKTEGPNSRCLIHESGKVIADNAARVDWAEDPAEQYRYLLVYFATQKTTDETMALLSMEESGFVSTYISDKGTWYGGYTKVYDLEKGRFVPGFETEEVWNEDKGIFEHVRKDMQCYGVNAKVAVCGDNLFVPEAAGGTLYNPEGMAQATLTQRTQLGCGILLVNSPNDNARYHVYDQNGNILFASKDNALYVVPGPGGYLYSYTSEGYGILDRDGNRVVDQLFDGVIREKDGNFLVVMDEKYGIIRSDGSWMIPCELDHRPTEVFDGYYEISSERYDAYSLLGPQGVIAENYPKAADKLLVKKDDKLLVLNQNSFDLDIAGKQVKSLCDGLVVIYSTSDRCNVYDLFTGEALLDKDCQEILYAAGRIYAYSAGTWTIYAAEFSSGA